jgi:hypothetical protein
MQDHPTTVVTMTAACELGSHNCKGVVLSLTGASWDAQTPCDCPCHGIIRNLPDAWAERVAAYPPCDDDLELEDIAEREADRRLDDFGDWS